MTSNLLLRAALLLLLGSISPDDADARKMVEIIMTRATGAQATFDNDTKTWSTKYGLNGVNLGNVDSSLKFIQSECIDTATGTSVEIVDGKQVYMRKNGVKYIHFYRVQYLPTEATQYWFSHARDATERFPQYDVNGFGPFLAFDGGTCNANEACNLIGGDETTPQVGPWIGMQDQQKDPRAPYPGSFWYSIPGQCPMKPWGEKTEECNEDVPLMLGEMDKLDGVNSTWAYELLGQVSIDDLVGITSLPENSSQKYKDYNEFRQAGNIEFIRDTESNEFVRGLDFWKATTDQQKNRERIQKLLDFYNNQTLHPYNKHVNTDAEVNQKNPECFENLRFCGPDAPPDTQKCFRDIATQACRKCVDFPGEQKCQQQVPSNWEQLRQQELSPVMIPTTTTTTTTTTTSAPSPSSVPDTTPSTSTDTAAPDQSTAKPDQSTEVPSPSGSTDKPDPSDETTTTDKPTDAPDSTSGTKAGVIVAVSIAGAVLVLLATFGIIRLMKRRKTSQQDDMALHQTPSASI